ncbi:Type 1 glutamine amidotransferase-like domain-containing protein [Pseudalkalibacillus decolorationis]|uniref:Type 1 glutamine amidotransferase-like domain-containing protein n=1 Tax=Pseudalkalibacillus decolorationis TaxID=163879 RepID=UPI0021484B15|nr:Type 1 glutamine amidotransferase-like domain-containing protein [Pseudalkalibacillus decolorationis]
MNLILLSNLTENLDQRLEAKINQMVSKNGARLGYIPSQFDAEKYYYKRMKPNLDRIGFNEYIYFDIDKAYDTDDIERLMKCDAIYLSGGNTFYFLSNLRKRGLIPFIKEFVRNDRMLIGVSAGAMVMSPTVKVAGIIDPNDIQLEKLDSFDIVPFHFLPHYSEGLHRKNIEAFTRDHRLPLYCCKDESGIVVKDDQIEFYGEITTFK